MGDVLKNLPDFRPEAMIVHPTENRIILISDEGGRLVNSEECKKAPEAQRSFHMLVLDLSSN